MTLDHEQQTLLRRALALATRARSSDNPPFGSLLIDSGGTILAEETNTTSSDNDITAHPELKLARWAARTLDPAAIAGVTMFTSCEPCAMCANAIGRAGITHVIFALSANELKAHQPTDMKPVVTPVATAGPYLPEENAAPVIGYYTQLGFALPIELFFD